MPVLLSYACIVELCLYCGAMLVLWSYVGIVELCLYCGAMCVLLNYACIVELCLYCGAMPVLQSYASGAADEAHSAVAGEGGHAAARGQADGGPQDP